MSPIRGTFFRIQLSNRPIQKQCTNQGSLREGALIGADSNHIALFSVRKDFLPPYWTNHPIYAILSSTKTIGGTLWHLYT